MNNFSLYEIIVLLFYVLNNIFNYLIKAIYCILSFGSELVHLLKIKNKIQFLKKQ